MTDKRKHSKGEIVVVDFGQGLNSEKSGLRLAVVVSANIINSWGDNVIVAPLTNSKNKKQADGTLKLLDTHVYLSNAYYKDLKYSSILQLEDIRSISRERVKESIGRLSSQNVNEANKKLRKVLGI